MEILKALYRDARILILDEPTAVLAPLETRELFATLRTLTSEGCSIIFISHKLYEVMEIADRVVVLTKGVLTAERKVSVTSERELANLMVGRDLAEKKRPPRGSPGKPLLEIRGLRVKNDRNLEAVKDLSLDIRSGEIMGMAGVSGNGQRELAEALFGLRRPLSGAISVDGRPLPPARPKASEAALHPSRYASKKFRRIPLHSCRGGMWSAAAAAEKAQPRDLRKFCMQCILRLTGADFPHASLTMHAALPSLLGRPGRCSYTTRRCRSRTTTTASAD